MSDRERETETVIRWDASGEAATLYTSDPSERRRWQKLGYDIAPSSWRRGIVCGWTARVPAVAVALLPLKGGVVQATRYLSYPTLAENARRCGESEKTCENRPEIAPVFKAPGETASGRG